MSILGKKSDEIKSWAVSIGIHALLLLIAIFFVTCWQEQIPAPDPGQGIDLSFGTVSEAFGETESPLTNGEQIEEAKDKAEQAEAPSEDVPEETIEPISDEPVATVEEDASPLESEDLNTNKTESLKDVDQPVEENITPETESETDLNKKVEEQEQETESQANVPALPGLPGVTAGGSSEDRGQVGDENSKSVSLSSGLGTAEIPNGWVMSTEPIPDIKRDGVVVISVEFNRNGSYVWNSARYVSGDHSIFSTYKDTKIEESLRDQLKLSTDGTLAPKIKNMATFRFEFKGR